MGQKIIAQNKKARFDYEVLDTFEAGIALVGSELKPLRASQVQLKDSFVDFYNNEMYLVNVHISNYKASSYNNHDPERKRKLLMNRAEIDRLAGQVREKGLTLVPLKLYFKGGRVKVELGLVRGKKRFDKRESIKKRDVNRDLAKVKRHSR